MTRDFGIRQHKGQVEQWDLIFKLTPDARQPTVITLSTDELKVLVSVVAPVAWNGDLRYEPGEMIIPRC